jgi:hypothetical protein
MTDEAPDRVWPTAATPGQAEFLRVVIRFGRTRVPATKVYASGARATGATVNACKARGFLIEENRGAGRRFWSVTAYGVAAAALETMPQHQWDVLRAAAVGTLFQAGDSGRNSYIGGPEWQKVTGTVATLAERSLLWLDEPDQWVRPWRITPAGLELLNPVLSLGFGGFPEGKVSTPAAVDVRPVARAVSSMWRRKASADHALASLALAMLQACERQQAAALAGIAVGNRMGSLARLAAANEVANAAAREAAKLSYVWTPRARFQRFQGKVLELPNRDDLVEILGRGIRHGIQAAAGSRAARQAAEAMERLGPEWDTLVGFALDGLTRSGLFVARPLSKEED